MGYPAGAPLSDGGIPRWPANDISELGIGDGVNPAKAANPGGNP